ncbi:hypothetical protein Ga0609869_000083 [Rhodovulum iodosum]|uniref:Uncharacterized protein n=1 Tax=Rhodovulum iodosum TaxID=68291 RepID=A0ABV3XPM3_9RHOB|nr:hypothetical protein [Rhodovulum robiginosum]RSK35867.1 hypothetical protein EJA01_05840 [Rhodovulum robiginosum]
MSGALDARLLAAHAAGDGRALARLYAEAAEGTADAAAKGFFLTHAYVFALEAGAEEAAAYRDRLCAMGREA